MVSGPAAHTLATLVDQYGGTLRDADPATPVIGLAGIDATDTHQRLSFFIEARYRRAADAFDGAALVVDNASGYQGPRWVHPQPRDLRIALHNAFAPVPARRWTTQHVAAVVCDESVVADGVGVGPGVIVVASNIGTRTRIAPNAVLEHCEVGEDCVVGAGAWIGPNVVLGNNVVVGPRAVIGDQGFGYQPSDTGLQRIPHIGGVRVEDDVHIGAGTCVDAGTLHPTTIGSGTRIDNLVHIAHNVRIGRGCVILAQAGVAGSATLEDRVVLAGQVGVAGHVTVGQGARVAAQSGVGRNVPRGSEIGGTPAFELPRWRRVSVLLRTLGDRLRGIEQLKRRVDDIENTIEQKSRTTRK